MAPFFLSHTWSDVVAKKKVAAKPKPKAVRKPKPKAAPVESKVVTLSRNGQLIEQDAPRPEGE